MSERIKLVTFLDLIFLTLLLISGVFGGAAGGIIYYSAFIIPIALGAYFIAKERKTKHGVPDTLKFSIKKEGLVFALPLFVPTLVLIMLISYATVSLMTVLGAQDTSSYGNEPFILAIVIHALIPTLAEELLFRYIPIELMRGAKNGTVITVTALMFSFAHANLFSIPHAFFAGVIFAAIDIAAGSILPSVILHFLNNALSLSLIYASEPILITLLIILGALLLACAVIIAVRKRLYAEKARELFVFARGEITPYPFLFVFAALFIAVTNIIFS